MDLHENKTISRNLIDGWLQGDMLEDVLIGNGDPLKNSVKEHHRLGSIDTTGSVTEMVPKEVKHRRETFLWRSKGCLDLKS